MEINLHQFERKKIGKGVKCVVCNNLIWSTTGYSCSICEIPAHKACAVKARKEPCITSERKTIEGIEPLPKLGALGKNQNKSISHDSIVRPPDGNSLSASGSNVGGSTVNNNLEIFFSDGSCKTIAYQPDAILLQILTQLREEKELEGNYTIYDRSGKVISNYDQSLKKLKSVFPIFYTVVENSNRSGKKKQRISSRKISKLLSPESKTLTGSPLSKRRSKTILGQKKIIKKYQKDLETIEQRNGTMSITLVTATDLANQTSAYKLLYFTITNLETNQRHRSNLLENNASPTWNQTVKFHMPYSYGQWNLKIWAIRKIDSNSADVLLGQADFELRNFKDGDSESKTLVLRQDFKKQDRKAAKKSQLEFLLMENQKLNIELEFEKKLRESLRVQIEELQKQSHQQKNDHNNEINSILTNISNTKSDPHTVMPVLQLEVEQLTGQLQDLKKELLMAKAKEDENRKNYEEQLESYKAQTEKNVEGGKKFPKILMQWSYQDRKLKNSSPDEHLRPEWIPTKSIIKPSHPYSTNDQTGVPQNKSKPNLKPDDDMDSHSSRPLIHISHTLESKAQLKKKKRIQDVFEFGEVLGTGGSSVVREGINKETSQRVAIKILDNYDNVEDASEEEEAFWAEIEIIKQLDHPCILNVYDFYEDSEHYYVVLELLSGNELFDQIIEKGYYDEPEAVAIIYQVLLALEHLESKHICHLDLKPENILFTDETHTRIKLIDFGEAASCKDHKLTGWVGTNNYMAPEMIKHLEYDCKVDMWSLGVVSYIMLCGSFAFDAEDEIELYQDIMDIRYEFRSPDWDHVSDDAKDFVSSLLTGPKERLSATQAINHRWIKANLPLSGFDPRTLK